MDKKEMRQRYLKERRIIVDGLYIQISPATKNVFKWNLESLEQSMNEIGFNGFDDNLRYRLDAIDASQRKERQDLEFIEGIERKVGQLSLDPAFVIIGMDSHEHVHDDALSASILEFCSAEYQTKRSEYALASKISVSHPKGSAPKPSLPILLKIPKSIDERSGKSINLLMQSWNALWRIAYISEVHEGPNLFVTKNPYSAYRLSDVTLRDFLNTTASVMQRARGYDPLLKIENK